MGETWEKKLFRLSLQDVERLDSLVKSLTDTLAKLSIEKPNRTLVIRALIMLGSEVDEKLLIEKIKEAKVYM